MSTNLAQIRSKVERGERLSAEEGLSLLTSTEIDAVCDLANEVRAKRVGDSVYYATTLYIHPTNLCELSCPMCSFYAKPGWKSAWFMTPEQIEEKVRANLDRGLTEIHVVGGLWRECTLSYYEEVFKRIKALDSTLHIKALTPVEYDFLSKLHGLEVEEVFKILMAAGLGSLPGGGAEILVEEIRKQLAPQKITSDEYLDVHRKAHRMGLKSNITLLFGHVEEPHHIVEHLCRVRELQDETGGFQAFVPLKYHVENNALGKRKARLKPVVDLRLLYSVCRLMLDNVAHLKVLWNYVGVDLARRILACGANDLSSTNEEERIIVMAGGIGQKVKMNGETLEQIIREEGRTPCRVHSGYA